MNEHRGVLSCGWSRLTLFLPYPFWLDSQRGPWTCVRDPDPRVLDDTEVCRDCPRWEPRALLGVHPEMPSV